MAPHGAKISAESTWLRVGTPSGPFHCDTEHPLPGTCQVLVAEGKSTVRMCLRSRGWMLSISNLVWDQGVLEKAQNQRGSTFSHLYGGETATVTNPCHGPLTAGKSAVRLCYALFSGSRASLTSFVP